MIRRALRQDARTCIQLLNLAMEDIAFALSGTCDQASSDEILVSFFTKDTNRISHQNVYVYEDGGEIIGAVCAYLGADAAMLDEPIVARLRLNDPNANLEVECFNDEFYIDSIAVSEKFRGRGIASELIKFIFELTKEKGVKKTALIVDENKKKTMEFYERLGFKTDCEKIINSHRYYHMIKEIL